MVQTALLQHGISLHHNHSITAPKFTYFTVDGEVHGIRFLPAALSLKWEKMLANVLKQAETELQQSKIKFIYANTNPHMSHVAVWSPQSRSGTTLLSTLAQTPLRHSSALLVVKEDSKVLYQDATTFGAQKVIQKVIRLRGGCVLMVLKCF